MDFTRGDCCLRRRGVGTLQSVLTTEFKRGIEKSDGEFTQRRSPRITKSATLSA